MKNNSFARYILLRSLLLPLLALPVFSSQAQETSGDFSGGSVKVGADSRACSGLTGSMRYNTTSDCMEVCDGTSWSSCTRTPQVLQWSFTSDHGTAATCTDQKERNVAPTASGSPDCLNTTNSDDLQSMRVNGSGAIQASWSYGSDFISNTPFWLQLKFYIATLPAASAPDLYDIRNNTGSARAEPRVAISSATNRLTIQCNWNGASYLDSVSLPSSGSLSTGVMYTFWSYNSGTTIQLRLCNGSTLVASTTCTSSANGDYIGNVSIGNGDAAATTFDYNIDSFYIYTGNLDPPC